MYSPAAPAIVTSRSNSGPAWGSRRMTAASWAARVSLRQVVVVGGGEGHSGPLALPERLVLGGGGDGQLHRVGGLPAVAELT